MTTKKAQPAPGSKTRTIPIEDLRSFVDDFPALLWRIEIAKSRIEFLNNHVIGPLGEGTRLVLQNVDYRQRVLMPEDAPLLDSFLDAVRDGRTMATVFRVHGDDGQTIWLKLTGAVNSRDPRFYYGYLLDIRDTVKVIQGILDTESDTRQRLDNAPTPVLLAEYATGRLHSTNTAARSLFRLPADIKNGGRRLCDLLPRTMDRPLKRVLRELPQTRFWEGKLEYKLPGNGTMAVPSSLRYVTKKGRGMVRLVLSPAGIPEPRPPAGPRPSAAGLNMEPLLAANDFPTLLRTAMDAPPISEVCQALMFSDVHVRKNNVLVYGAGEPLKDIPAGETFSYQGTIAEDIVRFGLDHLEVEDTMDSIKPIDWALFIPRGIRSYYAKPYFERGVLRTVLILCSTEPANFSGNTPESFNDILDPLAKALRTLRRTPRKG